MSNLRERMMSKTADLRSAKDIELDRQQPRQRLRAWRPEWREPWLRRSSASPNWKKLVRRLNCQWRTSCRTRGNLGRSSMRRS